MEFVLRLARTGYVLRAAVLRMTWNPGYVLVSNENSLSVQRNLDETPDDVRFLFRCENAPKFLERAKKFVGKDKDSVFARLAEQGLYVPAETQPFFSGMKLNPESGVPLPKSRFLFQPDMDAWMTHAKVSWSLYESGFLDYAGLLSWLGDGWDMAISSGMTRSHRLGNA